MSLSDPAVLIRTDVNAQFVAPCAILCDWQETDSGDIYFNTADTVDGNGYITDPDNDLDSSRIIFARDNRMGSLLGIRMKYQGGPDLSSFPLMKVFGRTNHNPHGREARRLYLEGVV